MTRDGAAGTTPPTRFEDKNPGVPICCVCHTPITGESMTIRGIYGSAPAHAGYTDCAPMKGDPYA